MVKELTKFDFEGMLVRTFGTKYEPWFAAVDVLRVLGISPKYMARTLKSLDDDEKKVVDVSVIGNSSPINCSPTAKIIQGSHNTIWIISEPGFYKIALRGRTEKAKSFTRFVTHEVLPSIRRRGYYLNPRWGFAPNDDGFWVLATGEKLTSGQVRNRAERMGFSVSAKTETKDLVRQINNREAYLALREKYPYTYEEVDRMGECRDVEYYRCFIKDYEDRREYSATDWLDEYFTEKFVELIKRVDEEYAEAN